MPRKKISHKGAAKGIAENHSNHTELQLDQEQALVLLRHISEALTYERGVIVNVHYRRRTGSDRRHRVEVKTP